MRHATPAVLPALLRAAAAICETGGVLNHLAVLARELGKPCVTGLPDVVDEIDDGLLLRVDGALGAIEVVDDSSTPAPRPVRAAPAPEPAMTPLVQFGRFTPAFECVDAQFTLEAAVRTAALVSVPVAWELGAPFEIDFDANRILVANAQLRRTTDRLVDRLTSRPATALAWRTQYDDDCSWPGWQTLTPTATHEDVQEALRRFVRLNQLTWAAALAKEPLGGHLRERLAAQLPPAEVGRLEQHFLTGLSWSGQSYILGARQISASACGETVQQAAEPLRALLDDEAFGRVLSHIDALAHLVSLTERKNTDLVRCAAALDRAPVAAALGLATQDLVDDGGAERRRRLVRRVVAQTTSSPHGAQ